MGTPAVRGENLKKHLTLEEKAARAEAENGVIPERVADLEKPPRGMDASARKYWREIVRRMDGLQILDDLDREMLGVYCQILARRDKLERALGKLLDRAVKDDLERGNADNTDRLESLITKISTLERAALQYADKLGLTPQGRARLAQKRAAAAADDPDADLFGDG